MNEILEQAKKIIPSVVTKAREGDLYSRYILRRLLAAMCSDNKGFLAETINVPVELAKLIE